MISKLSLSALAAVGFINEAKAAFGFGFCPDKPASVGNFDVERYMGRWYEIKYDKDVWFQQNTYCVTANYAYDSSKWIYPVSVNN